MERGLQRYRNIHMHLQTETQQNRNACVCRPWVSYASHCVVSSVAYSHRVERPASETGCCQAYWAAGETLYDPNRSVPPDVSPLFPAQHPPDAECQTARVFPHKVFHLHVNAWERPAMFQRFSGLYLSWVLLYCSPFHWYLLLCSRFLHLTLKGSTFLLASSQRQFPVIYCSRQVKASVCTMWSLWGMWPGRWQDGKTGCADWNGGVEGGRDWGTVCGFRWLATTQHGIVNDKKDIVPIFLLNYWSTTSMICMVSYPVLLWWDC